MGSWVSVVNCLGNYLEHLVGWQDWLASVVNRSNAAADQTERKRKATKTTKILQWKIISAANCLFVTSTGERGGWETAVFTLFLVCRFN